MKAMVKRWLSSPLFEGDEEKTLRANLLNTMLLAIMGMLVLIMPAGLVGGNTPPSTLLIDLFILIVCFYLRLLLRRGKVRLVGSGIVILGFVFVTSLVYSLGTIRAPTTSLYLVLVIISAILFGWTGLL